MRFLGDVAEHEHEWGPVEISRFAGTPHRKCQVVGCKEISLDLDDNDEGETEWANVPNDDEELNPSDFPRY